MSAGTTLCKRMEAALYHRFAQLEQTHWWFVGRRSVLRAALKRHLGNRRDLRILDVGCGTGGDFLLLREFGRVDGIDTSPEAIRYCREHYGEQFRVFQGMLPEALPQEPDYDLVTALDVIEHLEEPVKTLAAIRSTLTADGVFVCTVPAFDFLWSHHDEVNHHFRRYTRPMLVAQMQQAGFRVQRSSYYNTFLFPPIALVRIFQGLIGSKAKSSDESDTAPVSEPINALLKTIFSAESWIVPYMRLPFGVSILAVGSRPDVSA